MKSKRAKAELATRVVTIVTGYPLDTYIKWRITRSFIARVELEDAD